MKKIVLLFLLVLSISQFNFGQTTYLNENFSYGSTGNPDITSVATGIWKRHSGAQGSQYSTLNLVYSGYPLSNIGGSLSFTNGSSGTNDGDVNRLLSPVITTNSTIYVSFLLNLSSAKTTVDYFFHLAQSDIANTTPGTTFRGKVWAITNGAGYSLGLTKAVSSNPTMGTSVLDFNKTYLIIMKYQFSTATTTDDLVTLYVFGSGVPSTEPTTAEVATLGSAETTADAADIGAIAIRQGSNTPTGLIDGIRVASSWTTLTDVKDNSENIPNKFELSQNYPNPFNPETEISYQLSANSHVNLKVYDVIGREVATLVDEYQQAGQYVKTFHGTSLPSGIYFYTFQAGDFSQTKKMTLMK